MCNWITFCFCFDKNVTTLHTWFWFLLFSPEMHLGRLDDLAVMGRWMFLTDHLRSVTIPHLHLCGLGTHRPLSQAAALPATTLGSSLLLLLLASSLWAQSSPPPKDLCPVYLQKTQAVAQKLQMTPRLPDDSVSLGSDTQESLFSLAAGWEVGDRKGEVWVKGGVGSQCPVCGLALKLLSSVRLPSLSSHNVPSVP